MLTISSISSLVSPSVGLSLPSALVMDEKYQKRCKQRKDHRIRQAFALVGVTMIFLVYTWHCLLDIPGERHPNPPMKLAFKGNPMLKKVMHRDPWAIQDRSSRNALGSGQSNELSPIHYKEHAEASGGFLDGVKNMFRKNERQQELEDMLEELDVKIQTNKNSGIRWSRPELLPALKRGEEKPLLKGLSRAEQDIRNGFFGYNPTKFYKINRRRHRPMDWEKDLPESFSGPKVDYTKHAYEYPPKLMEPPEQLGEYPKLVPFKELMQRWPQDDIDNPPSPYQETLIHFDYNKPEDIDAAIKFREAKLPFKFVNVPEVVNAGELWTDEYLAYQFDDTSLRRQYPPAQGTAQESSDNFFAFFAQGAWPLDKMGIPPTRNNDWPFAKWAEHARYADTVGLDPNQPHFYWQAGVDREERNMDKSEWTFISRDLPSFSSPTETVFVFHPEMQKGIQCRFGERGVSAATHFDAGRNMVAMITGAKRYILSPPNQCSRLGIVNNRGSAIFRHSLLNFGHMDHMDNPDMPAEEREWLERAGDALALDTVLKAGEVLYIPSHWFHYITSLQKSAQCNVRSGVDVMGDDVFGGKADVTSLCEPELKFP